MFCRSRKTTLLLGVLLFIFLVIGLRVRRRSPLPSSFSLPANRHETQHDEVRQHIPSFTKRPPTPSERLRKLPEITFDDIAASHLLLPVTSGTSSLCKTILTAAVLGYPVPTLINYNKKHERESLVGGGRFVSKIDGVLEWLEAQPADRDEDIVIIVDAYGGFNYYEDRRGVEEHLEGDAWFQLPVEVLLARYRALMDRANEQLAVSMGRAYEGEAIRQSILFGSSKR